MIRTTRRSSATPAASVFAWTVVGVLVLGLAAAAWIGTRGVLAAGHLAAAQAGVSDAASDGDDLAAALSRLSTVADDTRAARELTSDPIWAAATALPWVGPQLDALTRTAAAIDDVAANAFEPLAEASAGLSPESLRPVGGAFDVARLAAVAPAASTAAAALRAAADDVAGIERAPLLGRLADAVAASAQQLDTAADDADALRRATLLVPRMLGADGPRSTLVLFENNAEWRSLGGVVGAVAQLDADDGRLALVAQASSPEFEPVATSPAGELPADVQSIYDTRPARFVQNATQVPDFSVGAPVARELWRRLSGTEVDAVVAVDPVTLSYLLRATGPVALPSGDQLTADNAVSLLLDEVYRRYSDSREQDAFFQSASTAVFQAVADGRADPAALIDAVRRAGLERRLLVWNADAAQQALLDGTTLQGALPVSGATTGVFGVYLNDGTGSKMDSYLHPQVETASCGDGTASVHVTLRSDAPDPATLPAYVTGGGEHGVPPGDVLTGVYVYLPPGAEIIGQRTTSDGDPPGFAGGVHDGRRVLKWSVQLAPGESADLEVTVSVPGMTAVSAVSTPTRIPDEVPRAGTCRSGE